MKEIDDEVFNAELELGINISRPERGSDADDRAREASRR